MKASGTLTCPRCGTETPWPHRCDCANDKLAQGFTDLEQQIIKYGFFRQQRRMEEAEESFRKIQAALRSIDREAVKKVIDDYLYVTPPHLRDFGVLTDRILSALPSASTPLTDEEICAAWNAAGPTRPEGPEMYLHYMRAIAKAQRDKLSQYVVRESPK